MATIRKRGSRWHAQVRRTGFPAQTKSFGSKTAAEVWARAIEAKADEGDSEYLPDGRCSVTFGELLNRYRSEVSPRKKGCSEELIRLRTLLSQPIAQLPLRKLSSVHLASHRDERLSKVSGETVRREFTLIRHCLKLARMEWGYPVKPNLMSRVGLPAPGAARERRLRDTELSALLQSGEKARNPAVVPMIRLAVHTGLRRGELLALEGQDIDEERRTLLVRNSKTGTARTIPLSLDAVAVLRSVEKQPRERLFPMTANAFRLSWERVKSRAGCNDLHFHDLRHEAISRFFEMGLTTPEVAAISGHRDVRMLMRYSHPTRVRILEVLDRSSGSPTST